MADRCDSDMKFSDWYKVGRKDIEACGGRGLFKHYSCLEDALVAIYPQYPWDRTKFNGTNGKVRKGNWTSKQYQRKFLQGIEHRLGVQKVFVY